MSKLCGTGHARGSRLAAAKASQANWPRATGLPPSSVSRVATRYKPVTGPSWRSASSTKAGTWFRSAASRSRSPVVGGQAVADVAQKRGGGLVAGQKELPQRAHALLVGQGFAINLSVGNIRDEVVTGFGLALFDHDREVVLELGFRPDVAAHLIPGGIGPPDGNGEVVRPSLERLQLVLGNPEHPGDHHHGQQDGVLADQIGATPVSEAGYELIGHRLHFGLQRP